MNLAKTLLAAMALVALLAACTTNRPQASPNPQPVCEAAESLAAGLVALRRMDPSTPVGDVKIAAAATLAAYAELRDALGDFAGERVDALAAAMRDLDTAIDLLPEDLALEDARALLRDELDAVYAAWRALDSEIGCQVDLNPNASPAS